MILVTFALLIITEKVIRILTGFIKTERVHSIITYTVMGNVVSFIFKVRDQ